jgi:hypothetical protein
MLGWMEKWSYPLHVITSTKIFPFYPYFTPKKIDFVLKKLYFFLKKEKNIGCQTTSSHGREWLTATP